VDVVSDSNERIAKASNRLDSSTKSAYGGEYLEGILAGHKPQAFTKASRREG
jgi:hypothetical protein